MQEFYTTEQHYVEALQLLVEVSDFAGRCLEMVLMIDDRSLAWPRQPVDELTC